MELGLFLVASECFAYLRPLVGELLDSFQDWVFSFLCFKARKLGLVMSPELFWQRSRCCRSCRWRGFQTFTLCAAQETRTEHTTKG